MVCLSSLDSPVLVIGAGGQVGSALGGLLGEKAILFYTNDLDLSKPDTIYDVLENLEFSAIINSAAYTAVDKAEDEEELAYIINAEAVGKLAKSAFKRKVPFIYYSTDYIFSGEGDKPWHEGGKRDPQNAYGRTKLAGENKIIEAAARLSAEGYKPEWFIFRTSWIYDEGEKNFLNAMLRLGNERETLNIVSDQVGAPTYALDLAEFTLTALDKALKMKDFPSGIYHLCNSGETTWYDFARAIFVLAKENHIGLAVKNIEKILTSDYPTPAKRPLNSRLNMEKLYNTFGLKMPDWEDGLIRCMLNKYG